MAGIGFLGGLEADFSVGLGHGDAALGADVGEPALVLQHPQEPDHEIGSAWLATECLENGRLKVGLSWPNLAKAWGEPVDASRWGVLHLGSGPKGPAPAGAALFAVDKKGVPLESDAAAARLAKLEGVIVLDGTWSQAKTL